MSQRRSVDVCVRVLMILIFQAATVSAATIQVAAGGDLQAALNAARPGDTILLEPGAVFTGNFKLPVHGGSAYVTVRSAAADALLPGPGVRITPAYAPHLPKITSPNSMPALRTVAAAAYWRLQFLELGPTANPVGNVLDLGDGSTAQNLASLVPHHLIVDRVYIHGDPNKGQKRGIALNSAHTTIANSHISDFKLVAQDSQAIASWNSPGPFTVENNYLEGAGDNVMVGGDDPKIIGQTPTDLIFRGNTMSRPVAWRSPIVPPPTNVRASLGAAGALPAGSYAYRVVARRTINGQIARSVAAAEVAVAAGNGSSVLVQWNAVPGATEYLVYGRTPGGQNRYWTTTTTSYVDDGVKVGAAGTPPATGTVWQVKNIFELKNARRVQVDFNIMENNWMQAQAGEAVLFTPRNQMGACPWCVVEDVTFEYNVVRHAAGGIQVLGWDNEKPAQQLNTIVIRHNEFSDIDRSWGGSGYFLYMIDNPRNVVVDHNTVSSNNGMGVIMADKRATDGFVFTNNVMRHNTYGIIGSNQGPGLSSITRYFPGSLITANVLAGGSAKSYPAGNLFPTKEVFETQFVDYAGGDYALVPTSTWKRAATDGFDLGADIATLRLAVGIADAEPLGIVTTSLPNAEDGGPYDAVVERVGGTPAYQWSVANGTLPVGLTLDRQTGHISGIPLESGDFTVTIAVTDGWNTTAMATFTLRVDQALPPVSIETANLAAAMVSAPYAVALNASGGHGAYKWSMASGVLPSGLVLDVNGVISGLPLSAGQATFIVTAADAIDAGLQATRVFTLTVAPPPNVPPTASLATPGNIPQVGEPVTLMATVADVDGIVTRVDFYANNQLLGSSAGPTFAHTWTVPTQGAFLLHAVAIDDDGAATASGLVTVGGRAEIVLYASQTATRVGNYVLKTDATAAGGIALANPNKAAPKAAAASASPASYAEFTFFAEAGRPYRLWIRGRAEWNDPANDSVFVQFGGVAAARIGTTSSVMVNLEEGSLAGIAGWGWQDNGYGAGVLGAPIVFETTGPQTLRLQPREDGMLIDQIVLSPERYLTTAPGTVKSDVTILGQ
jgi:hypothetical protein